MTAIGSARDTVHAPASTHPRPERRIFTDELPERARRGDLYVDAEDCFWRATTIRDDSWNASTEWRPVDLVTERTRTIVRALAAGMSAGALGFFLAGPLMPQWLGPAWGWPLALILLVLAAIAVIIADVAITAQSRMITIESITTLERKEPR